MKTPKKREGKGQLRDKETPFDLTGRSMNWIEDDLYSILGNSCSESLSRVNISRLQKEGLPTVKNPKA